MSRLAKIYLSHSMGKDHQNTVVNAIEEFLDSEEIAMSLHYQEATDTFHPEGIKTGYDAVLFYPSRYMGANESVDISRQQHEELEWAQKANIPVFIIGEDGNNIGHKLRTFHFCLSQNHGASDNYFGKVIMGNMDRGICQELRDIAAKTSYRVPSSLDIENPDDIHLLL